MKILILGGYGVAGPYIARQILRFTSSGVIISGRNPDKANNLAETLNKEFKSKRASPLKVDTNNSDSLKSGFSRADFIINASPSIKNTKNVIKAGISCGVDYLDIQYSLKKTENLFSFEEEIKKRKLHYFTECGSFPGIPAVLIRHSGDSFDELRKVYVAVHIKDKGGQIMRDSLVETVRELSYYSALRFTRGSWKKSRFWGIFEAKRIDFGEPFGRKTCLPINMEEVIRCSALYPGLEKTGMYASGYNKLVNMILMPIIMIVVRIFPESGSIPMARLLHWGSSKFDNPPWGIVMKAQAAGFSDGSHKTTVIKIFSDNSYHLTAASVTAVLRQYIKKAIDKPGVHISGMVVEPETFLEDLKLQGIDVSFYTET